MGENTSSGVLLFFLLALVVHLFDIFLRLKVSNIPLLHPMIIFYLALALLAPLFLGKAEETYGKKFQRYFALSCIAYFIPFLNYLTYLTNKIGITGSFLESAIAIILIFAPVWVIYLMFSFESTPILRKLGTIYLIFWLIIFLPAAYTEIAPRVQDVEISVPGILPGQTIGQVGSYFMQSITKAISGVKKLPELGKDIGKQITAQIEYAQTGVNPYEKAIMEANKKKLGVVVENLKPTEPVFYTDSPAVVFATFKADTIDKPFDIRLNCMETDAQIPASRIMPSQQFHIESYEEQEIDCIFDPNTLDKGEHTIVLSTEFDFKTMSQLETFAMDNERLKQLNREKIDPLAGYPQPQTITTKGPINLNIDMPKAPLGLEYDKKITFTINALNEWGGKIVDVKNLIIYVPKGIMIESITGRTIEKISCAAVPSEEKQMCDDANVNVYALAQSELQKQSYKDVTVGFVFRAYAKVEDYKLALGETPIAVQNFGASLEYDYLLEKKVTIKVKEAETPV